MKWVGSFFLPLKPFAKPPSFRLLVLNIHSLQTKQSSPCMPYNNHKKMEWICLARIFESSLLASRSKLSVTASFIIFNITTKFSWVLVWTASLSQLPYVRDKKKETKPSRKLIRYIFLQHAISPREVFILRANQC